MVVECYLDHIKEMSWSQDGVSPNRRLVNVLQLTSRKEVFAQGRSDDSVVVIGLFIDDIKQQSLLLLVDPSDSYPNYV